MAYQRPTDAYMHSNGSEFDTRYQPGAYRDEPQHQQYASDYYSNNRVGADSPYKQESQYEMEPQTGYGGGYPSQAPYKDYSSSHQNLAGGGAPGEYAATSHMARRSDRAASSRSGGLP